MLKKSFTALLVVWEVLVDIAVMSVSDPKLTVSKRVLAVADPVHCAEGGGDELCALCVSGTVHDGGQPGLLLSGWQLLGQRLLSTRLPAGKPFHLFSHLHGVFLSP